MPEVNVDDEVAALYRLTPEEFVAARAAAVTRIKAAGDDLAAARLRKVPKPTLAAWWVNQLVARWPAEVAQLLALGAELRQATVQRDRARLMQLDRRRRIETDALVSLLWEHGEREAAQGRRRPSAGTLTRVLETVTAAVMEPSVAELLGTGRIARPVVHEGFALLETEGDDDSGVTPLRLVRPNVVPADLVDDGADDGDDDRPRLVPATRAGADDQADLAALAAARVVDAEEALAAAHGTADVVEDELRQVETTLAELGARRDALRAQRGPLQQRVREAERALRVARSRLAALTPRS